MFSNFPKEFRQTYEHTGRIWRVSNNVQKQNISYPNSNLAQLKANKKNLVESSEAHRLISAACYFFF